MKMAKATDADLKMAMTLVTYLNDIDRGQMPDALSSDAKLIEWLDLDDAEQTKRLLVGIRKLLDQGSISRVVWGMAAVCDPANECIDPDANTLVHHPKRIQMEKDAERYRWLRDSVGEHWHAAIDDLIGVESPDDVDAAIDAAMAVQKGGAA